MSTPLTLEQALERYPLHPTARALVYERASRRLLDNPEEPPEQAVQAAMVGTVVQCAGCGLYVVPGPTVVTSCDVCGHPVCPECVRGMGAATGGRVTIIVICPRCFIGLPRNTDDIATLRRYILREANRPPLWSENGRHPNG